MTSPWWAPVSDNYLDPPDDPPWLAEVEDLTRHPGLDVQAAARAVIESPTEDAWDLLECQIQEWEDQFPKACACGRSYSETEWRSLPLVGVQHWEWGEANEMRNCECGSTLSVTLAEGDHELELELADIERDPDAVIRAMGRCA